MRIFWTIAIFASSSAFAIDAFYIETSNNWSVAATWENRNGAPVPRAPGVNAPQGGDSARFLNLKQNFIELSSSQNPITLSELIYQNKAGFLVNINVPQLRFVGRSAAFPPVIGIDRGALNFGILGNQTMELVNNLLFDVFTPDPVLLGSNLFGPGGITIFGSNTSGQVLVDGDNTQTGPFVVDRARRVVLSSSSMAIPTSLLITGTRLSPGGVVTNQFANQFALNATVTVDLGSLDLNQSSAQSFGSLAIARDGRVFNGVALTLNGDGASRPGVLSMSGGSLTTETLNMPVGNMFFGVFDNEGFSPQAASIVTVNTVNLGGRAANAPMRLVVNRISPGSVDVIFRNTQFVGGRVEKEGLGTALFTGPNVSFSDFALNLGRVLLGGTTTHMSIGNDQLLVPREGIFGGNGTIAIAGLGTLRNEGEVEPGAGRSGILTVEGQFEGAPGSILLFHVDNFTHSQMDVSGDTLLDGRVILDGRNTVVNRSETLIASNHITYEPSLQLIDRLPSNAQAIFREMDRELRVDILISPEAEEGAGTESVENLVTQRTEGTVVHLHKPSMFTSTSGNVTASAEHPRGGSLIADSLQRQQIDVGRFWAKPYNLPATVYVAPIGTWGKVSQIHVQPGFKFHSIGGLVGGDYAFNRAGVGALVGYEWLKGTEASHYGNFRVKSLFIQAYGSFLPLKNRNFFFDLIGGGSRNWYTFNRPALCLTAQGKPRGWEYDGYAGLGYNFNFCQEWRLTPLAGIQYMHNEIDTFVETGGGPDNLSVGAFKKRSLRSWTGLIFGGRLEHSKVIWMPEVRGFWQHEFAHLSRCLNVTSVCFPACKNIQVFVGNRNYGIVGAELKALFGPQYRWLLSGAYDYFWSRNFSVNNVYATFGINF